MENKKKGIVDIRNFITFDNTPQTHAINYSYTNHITSPQTNSILDDIIAKKTVN